VKTAIGAGRAKLTRKEMLGSVNGREAPPLVPGPPLHGSGVSDIAW
jgi:hypothetical protein